MHQVLLLGGGKIGRLIAKFLADSGDFRLRVADLDAAALARVREVAEVETVLLDATSAGDLATAMRGSGSVISALSFQHNPLVARVAIDLGLSYFDLTEDTETSGLVRDIASRAGSGQIFMPQCGLAPGFVAILANHLTQTFDAIDTVHLRVGALPEFPSNSLNYNLTWSTDGLINEYCNLCQAIHEGRRMDVLPLEGLETFSLDGICYEAFNTSGGLGTLCETMAGRVRELNYRTIRYLGHRRLMKFLIDELRLGQRRELLKDILENAVPITFQDVVVIFCSVVGRRAGQLVQLSDARKIYQRSIDGRPWSAIQITTAAGVCAVLDLHVKGRLPESGFVRQEQVDFNDFIGDRFGHWYAVEKRTGTTDSLTARPSPCASCELAG
ncbi:MAG: saccharopine dehydrogenase C-terminal domain-containing protein [Thermoguttaceae bacterium]